MSRAWKRGIIVGISLIISTGIYFVIQWANSPSKQTFYPEAAAPTKQTQSVEAPIATHFFTTNVPPGFRTQITENAKDPSMVQVTSFATDNSSIQIGIATAPLPTDGFTGVADYLYRIKSTEYQQVASTAFPADSPTFYKQSGGVEMTSFLRSGGRYASVVVSGTAASNAELQRVTAVVAKNWQWLE